MWKVIAALVVLAALAGSYLMRLGSPETPVFGLQRPPDSPTVDWGPQPRTLEDFLDGSVVVLVGRVTQGSVFIVEEVLKGKATDAIVLVGSRSYIHHVATPADPDWSERYLVICNQASLDGCRYNPFILDGPEVRFNDQLRSTVYLKEPGQPYSDPYTVPPDAFTVSPDDFIERIRDIVEPW